MKNKKLDIDRDVDQNSNWTAEDRLSFCLDLLENQGFNKGIGWETDITKRLTLEEVIGALVSAEQFIKQIREIEKLQSKYDE
jgi:hypothetical protein